VQPGGSVTDTDVTSATTGLMAGGIAGFVTYAELRDIDCRQGAISITNGPGSAMLGGGIGKTIAGAVVRDCSTAGNITVTKTSTSGIHFIIGGFFGDFWGGTANNCYSLSTVTLDMRPTATDAVSIGGFTGRNGNNSSYCYAKADINVTSYGAVYAGGFAARTRTSNTNTISNCYATGNVNVVSAWKRGGMCRRICGPALYGFAGLLRAGKRIC
jgi:hypothetical protein